MWFVSYLEAGSLLFVTSVLKFYRDGSWGSGFSYCAGHLVTFLVCWYMSLKMWNISWTVFDFRPFHFSVWFFFFLYKITFFFLHIRHSWTRLLILIFSPILYLCLFAPLQKISSTLFFIHFIEVFTSAIVFLISRNCLFFSLSALFFCICNILFLFNESTVSLRALWLFIILEFFSLLFTLLHIRSFSSDVWKSLAASHDKKLESKKLVGSSEC